jgi:hypothetical protein
MNATGWDKLPTELGDAILSEVISGNNLRWVLKFRLVCKAWDKLVCTILRRRQHMHVALRKYDRSDVVTNVGRVCPNLVNLRLNDYGSSPAINDVYATLPTLFPKLTHLILNFADHTTDEGFLALQSLKHIESFECITNGAMSAKSVIALATAWSGTLKAFRASKGDRANGDRLMSIEAATALTKCAKLESLDLGGAMLVLAETMLLLSSCKKLKRFVIWHEDTAIKGLVAWPPSETLEHLNIMYDQATLGQILALLTAYPNLKKLVCGDGFTGPIDDEEMERVMPHFKVRGCEVDFW